jgi:hypothetical protein
MATRLDAARACTLIFLATAALGAWQARPISGQDALVRVVAPAVWPPDGGTFEVRVEVEGVTDLAAFELKLAFDPVVLAYEAVEAGPFLGSTGRSVSCLGPEFFTPQRDIFSFACSSLGPEPAGPSGAGVLMTVRFRPAGRGPSPLQLSGVKLTDSRGQPISATVQGSSIVIARSAGTPVPTVTPVGASPEPRAPTATPAGPTATASPFPSRCEVVPLVAGCNLAAGTYPDGTFIRTIAGAVRPAGILEALWEFKQGTWLGYSPRFPQASDLTENAPMAVAFVCVSASGDLMRPAAQGEVSGSSVGACSKPAPPGTRGS